MNIVIERLENVVGKGENVGYRYFSPFPAIFSKGLLSGSLKVGICG